MTWGGHTPEEFFQHFAIDFAHPTVRDAVALGMVKLSNDSVSVDYCNDFVENKNYSPYEFERYMLHRNFKVNLVNLEPTEWVNITYDRKLENGEVE